MQLVKEYWLLIASILTVGTVVFVAMKNFYNKVYKPIHKVIMEIWYEMTPNGGGSMKDGINKISSDIGIIKSIQAATIKLNEVAIIQCNKEGYCTLVNKSWCEMSGLTPAEAEGWGWLNAVHEEDRERVREDWILAVSVNSEFNSSYKFHNRRTKKDFEVECTCIIDRNPKREVVSIVGTVIKLPEQQKIA